MPIAYVKVEVVFKLNLKNLEQHKHAIHEVLRYTPIDDYKIISVSEEIVPETR